MARDFTVSIHGLTVRRWSPPASAAFSQLRRAALSIRLNIAEGHALGTPGGFARHLNIAYGSAVESAEILEYCVETNLLGVDDVKPLLQKVASIQGMVIRLKQRCLADRERLRIDSDRS